MNLLGKGHFFLCRHVQPNLSLTYDFISAINPSLIQGRLPHSISKVSPAAPCVAPHMSARPDPSPAHPKPSPSHLSQPSHWLRVPRFSNSFDIGQDVISFGFEHLRSRRRAWEPSESSRRNILLIFGQTLVRPKHLEPVVC